MMELDEWNGWSYSRRKQAGWWKGWNDVWLGYNRHVELGKVGGYFAIAITITVRSP
jgi:hypothetical protein